MHYTLPITQRLPTNPLVWIDCEMTGLQPEDKILEIAVIITGGDLIPVKHIEATPDGPVSKEGLRFVIGTDAKILHGMNDWCKQQHGSSGLTEECLHSSNTVEMVQSRVLSYIKLFIPNRGVGRLAGSSVHADKAFLEREMPEIIDYLHYRIVDVSSVKELVFRWYGDNYIPRYSSEHRALSDIKASINELKYYKENIFRDPRTLPPR